MKLQIKYGTILSLLLALILVSVLTPPAAANGGPERLPFMGIIIEDNQAQGTLSPGEAIWYKFVQIEPGATFQQKMELDLILTPNQAQYVDLEVFSSDQARQWYLENSANVKGLGLASIGLHDGDPDIGRIKWDGQTTSDQTYYIRIANNSDFTVDYLLFVTIEQEQGPKIEVIAETVTTIGTRQPAISPVEATTITELPAGIDPNHPVEVSFAPKETILKKGHLAAGEDRWFALKETQVGGALRQQVNLTTFVTPADGNMIQKVHLDLFPGNYPTYWSNNNYTHLYNFGAGRIVERDDDPLVGELIWNGHLNNDETYYARLRNDNLFGIDYWLFTGDIINTELGEPTPAPKPAAQVVSGTDPNHPLSLVMGLNKGELNPGQERWLSFTLSDLDDDLFELMDLSLYFTPNDGNNLHQVHLDLFDGAQREIWTRGTLDQLKNFGAASIIKRDDNPETGELSWNGHLIDGNTYYIRLRNSSSQKIDYWLFTDQVFNPSLGELAGY